MTVLGSIKIWILIPDWSRLKSSEPKAGDVTHKIGPLYFNVQCKLVVNMKKWVDIKEYKYIRIKLVHAGWEKWQYALTMQVSFKGTAL